MDAGGRGKPRRNIPCGYSGIRTCRFRRRIPLRPWQTGYVPKLARRVAEGRRIGFDPQDSSSAHESVWIPAVVSQRPPVFASLGRLVQSADRPISVRVGLIRFALDGPQVAQLRNAARTLRSSGAETDHVIAQWLELWLRAQSGWRLDCEVSSSEPMPKPFLELIGNEIFGEPVEVFPDSDGSRVDGSLDLSCCRPADASLPRLFPAGVLLASLRQSRIYNVALPHLPRHGALVGEVECHGIQHPERVRQVTSLGNAYLVDSPGTL